MKKTIRQVDVEFKKVLVRGDLDVPIGIGGEVQDDRRIRGLLPTLRSILNRNGSVILMGHAGRPKPHRDPQEAAANNWQFSTRPVVNTLRKLLPDTNVLFANDVVGTEAKTRAAGLRPGEILVLQNLRFHPGEKEKSAPFARKLAVMANVFCNDAFATCHRMDASMSLVPVAMGECPRVIGLQVATEIRKISAVLANPQRPMVGILGGAKVSDKIHALEGMLALCDTVLVGGAMTYTFWGSQGIDISKSLAEPDKYGIASALIRDHDKHLVLPVDDVRYGDVDLYQRTTRWQGFDVGQRTVEAYRKVIAKARTIVWNGPMGKYEEPPFDRGTRQVARAVADSAAYTLVGGGDSADAIRQMKLVGIISRNGFLSTGGGAFLHMIGGQEFECLKVIDDV